MAPRDIYLNRRHRVTLIVAPALAMGCGGVAIGLTIAGLMQWPEHLWRWVAIGSNSVVFVWCLFVLIRRVRWLDSAVPDPVPPASASRPAV